MGVGNMDENNIKVCAIIVTYNRIKCLSNLIDSMIQQTQSIDTWLIFDNNSADDTADYLKKHRIVSENRYGKNWSKYKGVNVLYYRNTENSGGAGGFFEAIKMAHELDYTYLWIMDDDVSPESNCLELLVKAQDKKHKITIPNRTGNGFIDYAIVDIDLRKKFLVSSIDAWKRKIESDSVGEYVRVLDMPFEGPLINCELLNQIGLPNKDLFILFDDSEYALRASKATDILFVKKAKLLKQIIPSKTGNPIAWKVYYCFRNATWFNQTYGETYAVRAFRPMVLCGYWALKYLVRGQRKCSRYVLKGFHDGRRGLLGKTVDPANE